MTATVFASATAAFVLPSVCRINSQHANSTLLSAVPVTSHSSEISNRRRTACINVLTTAAEDCPSDEAARHAPVMRLSALYRYPIKATRGEALMTATLGSEGVANDRRYVIANSAGVALTQRDTPALATLEARLSSKGAGEIMQLRAGARGLNISVATTAPLVSTTLFGAKVDLVDQGTDASSWLAEILSASGGAAGGMNALMSALGRPAYRLLRAPGSAVGDGSLRGGAGLADSTCPAQYCHTLRAGSHMLGAPASSLPPVQLHPAA